MFEAGFGRSQGWRRPKCRLRRSVRPVGRDEGTREAGGLPGGRLLVLFAKESGSFKSHSPSRAAAAKPLREQRPRVLHGEAMPLRRWTAFSRGMTLAPLTLALSPKGRGDQTEGCRGFTTGHKKTAAQWLRFFYWLNLLALGANRATGLRHGASWSCRRCLPARCPSR